MLFAPDNKSESEIRLVDRFQVKTGFYPTFKFCYLQDTNAVDYYCQKAKTENHKWNNGIGSLI
jgi:hypothetical protein